MAQYQLVKNSAHLYADSREAAAALSAYVAEWVGFAAYELAPVLGAPDRAVIGYQVRVKDTDGFGLGYLVPVE